MSPVNGVHDRACELYQQIVGINEIRKQAGLKDDDNGPDMVRAVYGNQHYLEDHQQQKFYKPRMLRQVRGGKLNSVILAYPEGIPGGWNTFRKIHFIGHSMGA